MSRKSKVKDEFLSIDDVKNFLRIDDDDSSVLVLISAAEEYLTGAIGEKFPRASKKARTLGLLVVSDLYDNRQLNDASNTRSGGSRNYRMLISDIILQLKLEVGDIQ